MAKKNKKNKKRVRSKKKGGFRKARSTSASISKTIQLALQYHQSGDIANAELLYKKILIQDPDNADANHLLGTIAFQAGNNDIALQLIQKAVTIQPEFAQAHASLGTVLNRLNRMDEAIESFKKSLSILPEYAEVHYNLGNTLDRIGKTNKAIACYEKALAITPDFSQAHNNLGVLLKDKGQFDEAVDHYRKAVEIRPDFIEAYNNLGIALSKLNKLDEAIACYEKALKINPGYSDAYYNLGIALEKNNRLHDAIDNFQKAVAVKPDFAQAHHDLGNILKATNQVDEAIESYRNALSIKPDFAEAYRNLSGSIKHVEHNDDISAMEALYFQDGISNEDKMHLGFGLGKAFEDLKAYDESFKFILEANHLKRQSFIYSLSEDQAVFNERKKIFAANFISHYKGAGCFDETPVFIVGMPRSGTTLIEQILASHPLVFGGGEIKALLKLVRQFTWIKSDRDSKFFIPENGVESFKQAGQAYISEIRELSKNKKHIIDKMPHNFMNIGLIKSMLPNAKLIHCLRDPMDTCFSIFKNFFHDKGHKYAYSMEELGQYYNLYSDLMEHWRSSLPGSFYEIRYEDLVSDQENQTHKLLEYCGLPWDDSCLTFFKTRRAVRTASSLQVRQPIYKDSVRLWKQYKTQLEPLWKTLNQ
ncbi:MAG: tetratricopeptide repeat protein [Desulfobacteraceae bacterium]|nr:tetratricopeptide repeat protein [Desulfobacteraceae bacterium]